MFNFGQRLTALIKFTGISQKQLAGHLSFDPSYISRIRNYSLVPPHTFPIETIADFFYHAIIERELTDVFYDQLFTGTPAGDLVSDIRTYLGADRPAAPDESAQMNSHILIGSDELSHFISHTLPSMLRGLGEYDPLEIICTVNIFDMDYLDRIMDILTLCSANLYFKGAVCPDTLSEDLAAHSTGVISFLDRYSNVHLELYDGTALTGLNIVIIRNHLTILMNTDRSKESVFAAICTDCRETNQTYDAILDILADSNRLLTFSDSQDELSRLAVSDVNGQGPYCFLNAVTLDQFISPETIRRLSDGDSPHKIDSLTVRTMQLLMIKHTEILRTMDSAFIILSSVLEEFLVNGVINILGHELYLTADARIALVQGILSAVRDNSKLTVMIADNDDYSSILPQRINIFASGRSTLFKIVSPYGAGVHVIRDRELSADICSRLYDYARKETGSGRCPDAADYLERCITKLEIIKTLEV